LAAGFHIQITEADVFYLFTTFAIWTLSLTSASLVVANIKLLFLSLFQVLVREVAEVLDDFQN
jgi:hypothetical protein